MGDLCSRFFKSGSGKRLDEENSGAGNRGPNSAGDSPPAQKPQYSWDKRPKMDMSLYVIENRDQELVHRMPGTVGGNQFIVQNCKQSRIYVFDNTATVTVDDCVDCSIYLGPIKGSVFLRDCVDCRVLVACQQFRLRDCRNLTVFLSCSTQPIIESSTQVKFACFQLNYSKLQDQFHEAGLSVYNNYWNSVHDFTPLSDQKNFSLLAPEKRVDDYIQIVEDCSGLIDVSTSDSIVPCTLDTSQKPQHGSCLVVFFGERIQEPVKCFLSAMSRQFAVHGCVLVQTKEVKLSVDDARRVFSGDSYARDVTLGAVVGLEYCGVDVCAKCREVVTSTPELTSGRVHLSADTTSAGKEIENFYSFASMQMSV